MNQRIADCLFGEFHASACKNLKVIKGSLYLNHEQVFIQLKNKNEHKKVELGLEKKWGLWQLEYWKE
ncbi:MAG: hypothetical protein ACKVQC_03930 [Elusimicrobiota bacterium]